MCIFEFKLIAMKKIIFSFLSVFAVSAMSFGQITDKLSVGTHSYEVHGLKTDFDESIIGSPYINSAYLPSEVTGYGPIELKFNGYTGDMEFEENGERMALKKDEFPEVFLGPLKNKYLNVSYKDGSEEGSGYMKVLSENDRSILLKKEVIVFSPAQANTSGYGSNKPAAYRKGKDKYYIAQNGFAVEVPSNAKKFSQMFKGHESDIAEFIKSNKISFSKEADLIKLNDFIGTL